MFRTSIIVQVNEQLLKCLNMRIHIGVDHTFLDIAGDERHDIISQHERGTVLAQSSLGLIALDERFVGPVGSVRAWRRNWGLTPPQSSGHNVQIPPRPSMSIIEGEDSACTGD